LPLTSAVYEAAGIFVVKKSQTATCALAPFVQDALRFWQATGKAAKIARFS
jgi:hypothetical protein